MPSIAEAPVSPLNRMKRRRENTSSHLEGSAKLSSPHQTRHTQISDCTPIFSSAQIDEHHTIERRLIHAKPRRIHESKRQRVSLDPSHSLNHNTLCTRDPLGHNFGNTLERHPHDTTDRVEATREPRPRIDLNPCHICHRKPTVKSELDQYDDCEGCGRRTCYICMRKCEGWTGFGMMLEGGRYDIEGDYDVLDFSFHGDDTTFNGRTRNGRERMDSGYEGEEEVGKSGVWEKSRMKEHKSNICSGCCLERGSEGETWCLGCLRVEEGC